MHNSHGALGGGGGGGGVLPPPPDLSLNRCSKYHLDHSCNKYCDLIGQCKLSISHINL